MVFSFKSKKTTFILMTKTFFGQERLIPYFPVRLCVRGKLLAKVQTFWKTKDCVAFSAKDKQVKQRSF